MKTLIMKDHIGNVYRKIYEDFKPYKFRLDGAPVTSRAAFRDALYGNNAVNHRGLSMWFPVELKTAEKRTVYVVIYTDQNNRRVKHLYYQDTEPKGGVYYHRARINVENGKIIRRKEEVEYAE